MMDEREKNSNLDWKHSKSGLYIPKDVPEGGKKIIGFARGLQENGNENK